jgi:iron(III) transport system ATP-binding protein
MNKPVLEIKEISKTDKNRTRLTAINGALHEGISLGIAGGTGSGKTTLLKIIAGLLQPDAGAVFYKNKRIKGPDELLIPGHAEIAYVSQYFELRNQYTIHQVLEMADISFEGRVQSIAEKCQITELLGRSSQEVSGGERQRIAIAMALLTQPKLLLLDEPFSQADYRHKMTMEQTLRQIKTESQLSLILVSHDSADLLAHTDEIWILEQGQIIQQGKTSTVYRQPVNEYSAGLLGPYSLLSPAFCARAHIRNTAGRYFIARPDAFTIHQRATSLEARVEQVFFRGSYCSAIARCDDDYLQLTITQHEYFPGDKIYLSVDRNKIWPVTTLGA